MDEVLLLLSSLLAILLVRWLTDAFPNYSSKVLVWLGAAAVASAVGILVTNSHHNVKSYTTVRSMAKSIMSVLVKEAILSVTLLLGLLRFPEVPHYVLLILADTIISIGALLSIRAFARFYMSTDDTPAKVIEKAARRTALVQGTGQESVHLAQQQEKEGYEVLGLLVYNPTQAGLVVADYVVYSVMSDEEMAQLQWRLGGVDCVYFPQGQLDTDLSSGKEKNSA